MNKTVETIIGLLDSKKAENIRVFDVNGASDLWDYYIVCGGNSSVHAKALYDYVEKEMKDAGTVAVHRDTGYDSKWLILDYADVLVHIFDKESRLFYNIEKMWGEKEVTGGRKPAAVKRTVLKKKKAAQGKRPARKKTEKLRVKKTEEKKQKAGKKKTAKKGR